MDRTAAFSSLEQPSAAARVLALLNMMHITSGDRKGKNISEYVSWNSELGVDYKEWVVIFTTIKSFSFQPQEDGQGMDAACKK